MTKKLLAIVLGLSAWIGGTVAATIGQAGTATAAPMFLIARAHADYTPSLDGNDPVFVLLLGSDARPGTPMNRGLSDSIHILGINPAEHRATLYGIPRDSWVNLATGGSNKINAAMPQGGPEAEVKTVEALTGITFDYYVLSGFNEVTTAVNQLGGLVVDVPYTVQGDVKTYPEGVHRMNGHDVLSYARTRHSLPLGDFDRSLNQGVVLTSALAQFRTEYAKDPNRLYTWLGAGLRNTETSVPIDELIRLAGLAQSLPVGKVTNLVALGSSGMQGSQSVVNLSSENQALWQDLAARRLHPAKGHPGRGAARPVVARIRSASARTRRSPRRTRPGRASTAPTSARGPSASGTAPSPPRARRARRRAPHRAAPTA